MKISICLLVLAAAHVAAKTAITVDPNGGGGGGSLTDLTGTGLLRKYCRLAGKSCPKEPVESNYAGTEFQCVARCNQRRDCLGMFYAANRICHLLSGRCAPGELEDGDGADLYRLKEGESCPADRPQYTKPENVYSNTFCMLWGSTCQGDSYYKTPYKIATMEACLTKCAKIKTCGMVNYDTATKVCDPIISAPCPDETLAEAASVQNFQRLPLGATECSDNRGPPSVTPAPPTEAPPTEPPTETPEPVVPASSDCGGKSYKRKVNTKRGQTEVIASCNEGCAMTVCNCKKYKFCDGARFTPDGKCRVNKRTGKFARRARKKRISAIIRCEPASGVDVEYISTSTPGVSLQCGEGWDSRGDCAFYAKTRKRKFRPRRKRGKKCGNSAKCPLGRCVTTAVCIRRSGKAKRRN